MCNNWIGIYEYQINKLLESKGFSKIEYVTEPIDFDKQIHLSEVEKIYEIWKEESKYTSPIFPW
jgi:hypothetical protein